MNEREKCSISNLNVLLGRVKLIYTYWDYDSFKFSLYHKGTRSQSMNLVSSMEFGEEHIEEINAIEILHLHMHLQQNREKENRRCRKSR